MPADFGTGTFLAPVFLGVGDQDKDRKLTRAEFLGIGEKWFTEWDKEKSGSLNGDKLREGLNVALRPPEGAMPAFGAPAQNGRTFLTATEGRRNGLSSMMGIEFKEVQAAMEFDGVLFEKVAVRYKGNGTFMESRGSLKRSLKIDTNDFVKGQKIAGVSKLNLHNNVTDPSYMNEPLSLRLFRDAGVPAARTAYARVYVTVPGKHDRQYFGLYSVIENVDENFAQQRTGSKKGAIFKPSTNRPFTDLGDAWKEYNQMYDPKTELTVAQAQRVIDFCKLVSHADDATFAAKLGEYVDTENFARFMAVTVYLSSLDSILGVGQNYYVYLHPETQKLQFLPWDHDHSFGQFMMGGDGAQKLSIEKPWQGENPFLDRVFKVEAFKSRYREVLTEFARTIFQPERFHQQVDELGAALRSAVAEESPEKLESFDRVVAGEAPLPREGGGGGFPRPAVKPIKGFVEGRTASIAAQLAGTETVEPSQFGFPGGSGRGGPGGPGGGRGFEPGRFNGPLFMKALDADQNGSITRAEWDAGFEQWFASWDADNTGAVTEDQLRKGLNAAMPMGRPPGQRPGGSEPGRPVGDAPAAVSPAPPAAN